MPPRPAAVRTNAPTPSSFATHQIANRGPMDKGPHCPQCAANQRTVLAETMIILPRCLVPLVNPPQPNHPTAWKCQDMPMPHSHGPGSIHRVSSGHNLLDERIPGRYNALHLMHGLSPSELPSATSNLSTRSHLTRETRMGSQFTSPSAPRSAFLKV
jgi:hypothetical protein